MITTVRAGVSVGLLAGFYLLTLGIVGALGALVMWSVAHGSAAGILAVLLASAVLGFAIRVSVELGAKPVGVAVRPDVAPELWSMVRGIAGEVGAHAPDEIRLTATASVTLAEPAFLLGLMGGRRTLLLGLPLVQGLRADELRAVLAHELARHPRNWLFAASHRGRPAIAGTFARLGRLTSRIMRGYQRLYLLAYAPVQRHQEATAEQAMVRVAGPDVAAAARREAPSIASAWQSYLDTYVNRGATPDLAPTDILVHFPDLLAARPPRGGAGRGRPPSRDAAGDDRPATALIPHAHEAAAAVESAAFAFPGRDRVSLEDYTVQAARTAYRRDAQALHQAAARLAGQPSSGLGTVLDLIGAGRRDDLARAVALGDEPGGARLASGLRDSLVIAMVEAGSARLVHSWSQPHAVIGRNGDELDVGPLVTLLLAEPPDVATVRTCLSAMGVDLAMASA